MCFSVSVQEVALGGSRLHSKHAVVKLEPNRERLTVKYCLEDFLSSSDADGSEAPTDSIGAKRPEEMSESETPSQKEAPTQDATESTCNTKEIAPMCICMPWIQRIHFASVGM